MDAALELLDGYSVPPLDARRKARLAAAAVRAGALRSVPRVPATELRPRGRRHSRDRDQRAVRHHYDVSNEFFALFLGESMTYSCAIFSRGAQTLEEAQRTKLELVCTKLGLRTGERVLDVGCGWGSFALHAARRARRAGHRHHAVRAAGDARARAGGRSGTGRSHRDPRRRLPRPRRRAVRRDRLDRHGRARRQRQHRRLRTTAGHRAASPAGGCSTTASRGFAMAIPRRDRSPSASCSPTPRRCTSRASSPRSRPPASSRRTSRAFGSTTPARCASGRDNLDEHADRARGARRGRAHARLAAVPARGATRLRDRLHVDLPDRRSPPELKNTSWALVHGRGRVDSFGPLPACPAQDRVLSDARPSSATPARFSRAGPRQADLPPADLTSRLVPRRPSAVHHHMQIHRRAGVSPGGPICRFCHRRRAA